MHYSDYHCFKNLPAYAYYFQSTQLHFSGLYFISFSQPCSILPLVFRVSVTLALQIGWLPQSS